MSTTLSATATTETVDVRAVRFGAAITATVTGLAFLTVGTPASIALLAWQTSLFALVVAGGFKFSVYGRIFKAFVAPRVKSAPIPEPVAPARFAQLVGLLCAGTALVAGLLGFAPLAATFAGITFVASFLNAAFNFCLGCEVYTLGLRVLKK
jgi:hypothetical protein